jgi:SH3 domain-containing protein
MKSHAILAGVAVLFLATGTAHAVGTCEVVDPTGTPLNVRVRPNGKVLFTLRNGAEVVPLEESDDHKWVKVFSSKNTRKEGWVFYNFLDCGDYANAIRSCRQQNPNDCDDDLSTTHAGPCKRYQCGKTEVLNCVYKEDGTVAGSLGGLIKNKKCEEIK